MSLTFLNGQVGHMRDRGMSLHALSSSGPELSAFGRHHRVSTFAVNMTRDVSPMRDLMAMVGIIRVLRKVRPHIVHAHTPKGGLLGMIAATAARIPVRIYHMRGLPMMGSKGARRLLLRSTERIACRFAHRVLCVSHSLRNIALSEKLCSAGKIDVLAGGSGQGVDAQTRFDPSTLTPHARKGTRTRLGIPLDGCVVGFVGRLVRDKGVIELESAWRSVSAEGPDLHLLLVGPWEPQDPVPHDVRSRLEDDPRVHLVGLEWDTPPLYAAMDILALPTYREGFPNVPLEAAAMELPVVATRIPGCVDAVADGVTGTLVPARDSAALAAALRSYIDDPSLRRRYGTAGRERVLREFRPEMIYEALYGEYCTLLLKKGLPFPGGRKACRTS